MTYGELFKCLCDYMPEFTHKIIDYRPWGNLSIIVWLKDGTKYKCKYRSANNFVIQQLSDEDVNKKFNLL